jgi:glycerol-3-phosphate dehydrogenase
VSIVGGKLTTYRRMAQDAVDAAVEAANLTHAGPCRTKRLPLVGAAPRDALAAVAAPRRLVDRHGTLAPEVVALADGDPELLQPLLPGLDVIGAEVLYAAEYEGALDADDVLDRRTRIGLLDGLRANARPVVEALLAGSGQASAA